LGLVLLPGMNTLVVEVVGNSGTDSLNYGSITCINLELKQSANFNPLLCWDGDLTFSFIPVGAVKKRLNVYIDGSLEEAACKDLLSTDTEKNMSVTVPHKSHGVHTLKAELVYDTGVSTATSNSLEYEVVFIDSENSAPIIWFNNAVK
jgi:hypothetical protein